MSDDFQQLKRDVAALRAQLARVEGMARAQVPTSFAGAPAATTLVVTQASHGFAVKDPVRYNGTAWVKSTADTAANAVVAGIVTTVINANTVIVTTGGYAAGLSALTAGSVYYLDTAGGLTATAPALAVPVLMADSTTSGVIIAGSGGGSVHTATTDPGSGNDSSQGYSVGSLWVNTTADKAFIAADVTVGAAIWLPMGLPANPSGAGWVLTNNGSAASWSQTPTIGNSGVNGKLVIQGIGPAGNAVEIDAALVPSSTYKLTIRQISICDAGTVKSMYVLGSASF